MDASLVEPTPECPRDRAGECRFMVGLSPTMIGSERPTHNGHLEFLKPYIQVYPVVQDYSRMFRLNSSYIAHCASSPMWMLTGSFGRPASAWLSRVINSVSEAT